MIRLNGLDFHVEVEGHGPPLLLLHGFTGSARNWDEVRPDLARFATIVVVDIIGHGKSAAPQDHSRYSLDWSARDLAGLLDALQLDRVDLLGYSMGGRVALNFALTSPERVKTVILESASPGIEDASERQRRLDSDRALADDILHKGVEAFVAEWERQPLLEPAPGVTTERRAIQRQGRLQHAPLGLANSLRGMGAGAQTPNWNRLADLRNPTHLIVGERDLRYRDIAERMLSLLPSAGLSVVADAGHTVHLDQPQSFVAIVEHVLLTPN